MEAPDTGIEAGNTVDNPPLVAVQWASNYLWIVAYLEMLYSNYHLPQVRKFYIQ